jgi:DNA-directed RNA polymerase specialized sigma24 family protein
MERRDTAPQPPASRLEFPTTHWSVVLTAGKRETTEASAALEQLCRTYWYPLYAYVRRRGFEPADAEDLTQQFFAQLLHGNFVARADPNKGKFRAFLLSGIKYLLSHEREKAGRLKRGGGVPRPISLDQLAAEARYRQEPVDTLTPERVFERTWLATLLEAVGRRLRAEYVSAGKGEIYALLKDCRLDAADQPAYREVAARLGQSVSAVKSAIWRLRRRHEALIREAIAQTLDVNQSVEEEIRHLLEVAGPR